MPIPDQDKARPARPGDEEEELRYRHPEAPADHSVTIDPRDGTFTYRPSPGPKGVDKA
ncbi:MAG TPA: hypothetical protein VGW40_01610 [Allosphingosinicella sp.]|nr:hypothetical protein [Allosphingosinicella sp.]